MIKQKNLLIRADASDRIGVGHVMRCWALAQSWQKSGGNVILASAEESPVLKGLPQSNGLKVVDLHVVPGSPEDAAQTAALAQKTGAAWVVIDGYHFECGYQGVIKKSGTHLLVIDDTGQAVFRGADIVLNQNIHAGKDLYRRQKPFTRLLLGVRYALLRPEFERWRKWKRKIPANARKILVTFGGGDPDNTTLKVIQALNKIAANRMEVVAVAGPSNAHISSLKKAAACSLFSFEILSSVKNMSELMAWADIGISAGGSTLWELAFMGLPSLILTIAANQSAGAEELHKKEAALNLGWHRDLSQSDIRHAVEQLLKDRDRRKKMARKSRELVDGKGVQRVISEMNHRTLNFRKACPKDCRLLWEWTNLKDVRAVSFTSETIPWKTHVDWFELKLKDPHCLFYIIHNGKRDPIGQVRYDLNQDEATISISIDPNFRGAGYGSQAIRLLSQEVFNASDVKIIHAYVKQSNAVSAGAFVKAGFKDIGTKIINGQRAVDLALIKDAMI